MERITAESLARALGGAVQRGDEWRAICPAHQDSNPSLSIVERDGKVLWTCRAGCSQSAVTDALRARALLPVKRDKAAMQQRPRIVKVYEYHDAAGVLVGQVCRMEPKSFRQRRPDPDKSGAWLWKMGGLHLPLYRLPELARAGAVVIAEGEKDCDALWALGIAATCNPGGAGKWRAHHTAALVAKRVAVIADADGPGRNHAQLVAHVLHAAGISVRVLECPPPHKDPADWIAAGASRDDIAAALKAAPEWTPALEAREDDTPLFSDGMGGGSNGHAEIEPAELRSAPDLTASPFRPLGFDHGLYYYLPRGQRQVVCLAAAAHGPSALMQLAPLTYWEREFAGPKGASWGRATDHLFRACEAQGVYDLERVRGRGAWWDEQRVVLHCGDALVVDGRRVDIAEHETSWVYEQGSRLAIALDDPLPHTEAKRLLDLCLMLPLQDELSAKLLAGWIVLAPICGALRWRPHLWLTGASGSGKTWILEHIIAPLLHPFGVGVHAGTTEPGIRAILKSDARPVMFDESGAKDRAAAQNIGNVLSLMRASSAETGAKIAKGFGVQYRIRSMFAFASVAKGSLQQEDENRITTIDVVDRNENDKEGRDAAYEALKSATEALLTLEFIRRFHARTISLLPLICANAETFAAAGSRVIGSRRSGDQFGALAAGVAALHSNRRYTLDQARAWMDGQEWADQVPVAEGRDEIACLQRIMQHVVRVQGGTVSQPTNHERTIGELVDTAVHGAGDGIAQTQAADALLRIGIKVEARTVYVANQHSILRRVLVDTPWGSDWGRVLRRLPGAFSASTMRFGPGTMQRATALPLAAVLGE